jgi:hypothetical protein
MTVGYCDLAKEEKAMLGAMGSETSGQFNTTVRYTAKKRNSKVIHLKKAGDRNTLKWGDCAEKQMD